MFKQYKEAIESSNIVSKTDIKGIITFVNDEFCKISGYSREELIGQNHNVVRHPDVPKEKFKRLWETILAKRTYKATVKNLAKNGRTFYVNTTIVPILDEKNSIEEFIAIRYDVTKEVELKIALEKKERELEQLNRTLEERVQMQTRKLYDLNRHLEERIAEEVRKNEEKQKMLFLQSRMASLGQMMANIAHQWRQPLTELSLALYNLKTASIDKDRPKFETAYNDSKNLIQSMSQTIEDFIDFFKPNRPQIRFSLETVLDKALKIVDKTLQKELITITRNIHETLQIEGIPNELAQVLLNIFQNSKDAFRARGIPDRDIHIHIYRNKSFGVIEVSDNAGGIEASILDRIFEPYFTTKHAAQGTGLGLFLCKTIIEKRFNGTIEAHNTKEGAMFLIRLPLPQEHL